MRRLLPLLLLSACSDLTDIDPLTGAIETEASVDFGDVQVGLLETREIRVRNVGQINFEVASVVLGANFSESTHAFNVSPTSFALAPGGSQIVGVNFQAFEP